MHGPRLNVDIGCTRGLITCRKPCGPREEALFHCRVGDVACVSLFVSLTLVVGLQDMDSDSQHSGGPGGGDEGAGFGKGSNCPCSHRDLEQKRRDMANFLFDEMRRLLPLDQVLTLDTRNMENCLGSQSAVCPCASSERAAPFRPALVKGALAHRTMSAFCAVQRA